MWGLGHYGQFGGERVSKESTTFPSCPLTSCFDTHCRIYGFLGFLHPLTEVRIRCPLAYLLFAVPCRVRGWVRPAWGEVCAGLPFSVLHWRQALLSLPCRLQGLRRTRLGRLHCVQHQLLCPLQWHVFWAVPWRDILWKSHWRLSRLAAVFFPRRVLRYKWVSLKSAPKGPVCTS